MPQHHITLRTHHNTFVSARNAAEGHRVTQQRDSEAWEHFTFVNHGGPNKGYLKTAHGMYLSAQPSGQLEANRTEPKEYELFELVHHGPKKVNVRSVQFNKYLCAEADGSVTINRDAAGEWELFHVDGLGGGGGGGGGGHGHGHGGGGGMPHVGGMHIGGGSCLHAGNKVRFENVTSGKNVAVMPDGRVHGHGDIGPHAHFTVEANRGHLQFKCDNGGYLAIKNGELSKGGGGKWCDFNVVASVNGAVNLRSPHGDWGVGFDGDGSIRDPKVVKGGAHGQFKLLFFTKGQRIRFGCKKSGKNVAVMPNGKVHGHGGTAAHATFTVETARGHFQFLNGSDGYLAIKNGELARGGGGKWCDFSVIGAEHGHVNLRSPHGDWGVGFDDAGEARDPAVTKTGGHGQFVVHDA